LIISQNHPNKSLHPKRKPTLQPPNLRKFRHLKSLFFKPGDAAYEEISYPIAHRVLSKCDAVLRIKGASKGADMETAKAKEIGLIIYYDLEAIPTVEKW